MKPESQGQSESNADSALLDENSIQALVCRLETQWRIVTNNPYCETALCDALQVLTEIRATIRRIDPSHPGATPWPEPVFPSYAYKNPDPVWDQYLERYRKREIDRMRVSSLPLDQRAEILRPVDEWKSYRQSVERPVR